MFIISSLYLNQVTATVSVVLTVTAHVTVDTLAMDLFVQVCVEYQQFNYILYVFANIPNR